MTTDTDKGVAAAGRGIDIVKWLAVVLLLSATVVGNAYYSEQPLLYRAVAGVVLVALAAAVALLTERGRQFNAFRREAMIELRKIVWPTRQETIQTTLIVFVVVFITAIILYLLDLLLGFGVSRLIG